MIVAVDHFAGLGWGVACHRLGIREYGVEIAKSAIRMRTANGMRTIYRDVWSGLFDSEMVPEHDLYIASPPCQTFSMAGKGDGRKALDDVLGLVKARAYSSGWMLEHSARKLDPRTALVLTPLAHIWQHRPRLVALEQVPEVLPVWNAYAAVLRTLGYSVWAGVMRAEQHGVPQTRKRAILMARLDGKVGPPAPTHSRYYSTDPGRLDPGVLPWVSMAEALGFGLASRPSPTITGGGTETGGAEPIAKLARYTDSGDWVMRSNQRKGDTGEYNIRSVDAPSLTLTANSFRNRFEMRADLAEWEWLDAPATTVAADPRITAREHHEHGEQSGTSLRLTYLEAAALQSFPPSMRWPGNQGERFLAIGNAVPPLMAEAILSALIAPPAERDAWDLAFAEIAG